MHCIHLMRSFWIISLLRSRFWLEHPLWWLSNTILQHIQTPRNNTYHSITQYHEIFNHWFVFSQIVWFFLPSHDWRSDFSETGCVYPQSKARGIRHVSPLACQRQMKRTPWPGGNVCASIDTDSIWRLESAYSKQHIEWKGALGIATALCLNVVLSYCRTFDFPSKTERNWWRKQGLLRLFIFEQVSG